MIALKKALSVANAIERVVKSKPPRQEVIKVEELPKDKPVTSIKLVKKEEEEVKSDNGMELENVGNMTLTSVTNPTTIPNGFIKRKYNIKLHFVDGTGKSHVKTVKFGHKGIDDYVDHHDEKKRDALLKKLKNTDNIVHSNYWRKRLLNSSHGSVEEAVGAFIKELPLKL